MRRLGIFKKKLVPLDNSEEYKEYSKNLLKTLEKEERDQKIKKKKKYIRDKEDYQTIINKTKTNSDPQRMVPFRLI